jgi:octaprenyl-diphosphate synthase
MAAITFAPPNSPVTLGLEEVCLPILGDLAEAERIFTAELHSPRLHVRSLIEHLGHYRGKRLRPMLLLLTAQACGRIKREHHILAAVVEMIHTATLVHDDVLDKAEVRRHVPTVNAKWGNHCSVLLGDLLFTHAFHLASTTGSTVACRIIGETTNRVCEGELHQINEQGNLDLTEDDYFDIIDGKTAELTACCCKLAAIFSEVDQETVEQLTQYGRDLGISFQIADDVLDLVGVEEETGKSLGTDFEQQKLTLPMIRLLNYGSPQLVRQARQCLRYPNPENRYRLAQLLNDCDALSYTFDQAESYAARARATLSILPSSDARTVLEKLTHHVVHRKR